MQNQLVTARDIAGADNPPSASSPNKDGTFFSHWSKHQDASGAITDSFYVPSRPPSSHPAAENPRSADETVSDLGQNAHGVNCIDIDPSILPSSWMQVFRSASGPRMGILCCLLSCSSCSGSPAHGVTSQPGWSELCQWRWKASRSAQSSMLASRKAVARSSRVS